MPTIITRGAASAQAFGFNTVALGGPYWITKVSSTTYALNGSVQGVTKDSSGNYYLPNFWTIKFDSSGNAQAGLRYSSSSGTISVNPETGSAFSDGSLMYITSGTNSTNSYTATSILKQYTGGGSQFTKNIGQSSNTSYNFRRSCLSTDNNFCAIWNSTATPSNFNLFFYKYSSDGTLLYCRNVFVSYGAFLYMTNLVPNSNGAVCAISGGGVVSLSGTGVFSWAREVTYTSVLINITNGCCDNNANTYWVALNNASNICYYTKFDSSGNVLFSKYFIFAGNGNAIACSCDSSNNLYIASGSSIVKIDSSGTVIYNRSITSSSGAIYIYSLNNYKTGLIISATMNTGASPSTACLVLNLPQDGSKTGIYTVGSSTITYSTVSTASTVNITATTTSRTFSTNAVTPTETALTMTNFAPALTGNTAAI